MIFLRASISCRFVEGFSEAAIIKGKALKDNNNTWEFDALTHKDAPVMAQVPFDLASLVILVWDLGAVMAQVP